MNTALHRTIILCDTRYETSRGKRHFFKKCTNQFVSSRNTIAEARSEAYELGWRSEGKNDYCPGCASISGVLADWRSA